MDTPTSSSIFSFYGTSLDENRPLLTQSTATSYTRDDSCYDQPAVEHEERMATASPFSGISNLLNTILGTGVLAMPAAVATVGLIPGMVLTLFSGITSGTGLYFLSESAARVQGRHASFFAVSQLTWPSAAMWFDTAIAIKCFGVAVSYLIIIGDLLPLVVLAFASEPIADTSLLLDRRLWILVVMAILAPLSYLRTLNALRHISALAIVSVVYLCAIVVYHYFTPGLLQKPEHVDLWHITPGIFSKLPVFIFAFTCHQNIFTVHNELKDNSRRSMIKVILWAIGSAAAVYELVATVGYLSFGRNAKGNIILEYPPSPFVAGGRVAIVILVMLGYPLQLHPCRASFTKVLEALNIHPPMKHYTTTTALIIGTLIIAVSVSQLDLVLAFVGSTGSTSISFILPGLFYYKLHQDKPWTSGKIIAVVLAAYGVAIMSVCLTFNIIRLFTE
ncbi:hypothetical protein K492DRAFT_166391 [Lichtheimia hyalospora FSU 10163]|nr:hypothetical protein K492DRAFT_166391 [Lichtheimia hyalospora FSU 10163]